MPGANIIDAADVRGSEVMPLDEAMILQLVEVFKESLGSIRYDPPLVEDPGILDRLQAPDELQVLRHGHQLRGRDLWEALLTSEVQETLFHALVPALTQTWRKTAVTRLVLVAANLLKARDAAAALDTPAVPTVDTVHRAGTISTTGTMGKGSSESNPPELAPGNFPWQDVLRAISARSSSIGEDDIQLLDKLSRFPDLYSKYLGVLFIPIEGAARELSETLTDGLIGYVAGVTDRTVRSWISGRHTIRRGSAIRLRVMLAAVRILLEVESPRVVLRWFANTNFDLNDDSPAEVLRKGEKLDWVIRSAAAYTQDGV